MVQDLCLMIVALSSQCSALSIQRTLQSFGTQYPVSSSQHPALSNQSLPGCDLLVAGNSIEDGQAPVASASVVDSQNFARPGTGTGSGLHHPHVVNETCQPCVALVLRASSRPNFGIPAKLYIDETDYADRMLGMCLLMSLQLLSLSHWMMLRFEAATVGRTLM